MSYSDIFGSNITDELMDRFKDVVVSTSTKTSFYEIIGIAEDENNTLSIVMTKLNKIKKSESIKHAASFDKELLETVISIAKNSSKLWFPKAEGWEGFFEEIVSKTIVTREDEKKSKTISSSAKK